MKNLKSKQATNQDLLPGASEDVIVNPKTDLEKESSHTTMPSPGSIAAP